METVVIWIFIVSFLDTFAVSLLLPLIPTQLKALGVSYFVIGCVSSIFAFSQLISGPIIGSWSDRIGRQRILIFSLLLTSVCHFLLGLFNSLTFILAFMTILGVFDHVQVLIRTVITDRVPGDQHSLIFGRLEALTGVAFTLGPAIGGNLAELANGFGYVCHSVGVLLLINSVVVYFCLNDLPPRSKPESNISDGAGTKKRSSSIFDAIRDLANINWPMYWEVFALKFFMDFSAAIYTNNYSIKVQEKFGISLKLVGYTMSLQSFVAVLAGLFVGFANKRFYKFDDNYRKRSLHGYAVMMLAYFGIGATEKLSVFMFWSMLLKIPQMFLRIVLTEMLISLCPSNRKGSLIATGNSIFNTTRLVAPLVSGFVEESWGSNSAFFMAATAATFGLFLSLTIRKQHIKSN